MYIILSNEFYFVWKIILEINLKRFCTWRRDSAFVLQNLSLCLPQTKCWMNVLWKVSNHTDLSLIQNQFSYHHEYKQCRVLFLYCMQTVQKKKIGLFHTQHFFFFFDSPHCAVYSCVQNTDSVSNITADIRFCIPVLHNAKSLSKNFFQV